MQVGYAGDSPKQGTDRGVLGLSSLPGFLEIVVCQGYPGSQSTDNWR